jgi:hypothetical protein
MASSCACIRVAQSSRSAGRVVALAPRARFLMLARGARATTRAGSNQREAHSTSMRWRSAVSSRDVPS